MFLTSLALIFIYSGYDSIIAKIIDVQIPHCRVRNCFPCVSL